MASPPTVGQLLGRYRILEKIGSGGMGVVFRAHDERLDRDVAIKTLPELELVTEATRRQFRREALSLAKISDPHVAMAFDFGHDNGTYYLVTELVPGLTLEAKLAGRPLPEAEVLHLGKQLASGLESAHSEGVIHRDLKPGNLKVTPDGRVKILGLGPPFMLKHENDLTATAPLSETSSDAGTLPYMAPEQLKGQHPDARADLWSAGVVLYEMSTGRTPFKDLTGARLIGAILDQAPMPPREVNPKISEGLERVIMRALQKDPKERYQSAGDLRIDLANLETSTGLVRPRPLSPRSLYAGPPRLRNWQWWLPVATVAVLGVAGLWWQRYRRAPAVREERMMAVLPFESAANDPPMNALGLGLTQTVTAKLVQAVDGGHLQLVSTRDLVQRGVKTSDQARREFGTDLVLEGSLQQNGDRLRVTWSLVDPRTHTQIAANTITGSAEDVFGLQDNLFDEVLEKLSLAIDPGRLRALEQRPDTKPAAYDFYLRGRGYLEDYQSQDNLEKAIAEFEHAISVDNNYSPAYAAMGLAYTTGFQWKDRGKDWLEKAATQWERGLAVTPKLAEGHTCLGNVFFSKGRYEDAVQQFQRSLDLDHNNDEALRSLAAAYQKLGNPTAAAEAYRKAFLLCPNYWGVYSAFGAFYYNQARYSDAVGMFNKTIELAPLYYNGYSNLGAMYLLLGKYPEAVKALTRSIGLRPTADSYGHLGTVYFYMRRYADAGDSLQRARKIDPNDWLNWGSLGDTLFQIPARRAEANSAYQKAIDLANARLQVNPRDALTLAFTADYCAMMDREPQAREKLARALEAAPGNADVLFRAAILYNHFGNAEKTIEFLTKAVAAGYSRTVIRDTPDFDRLKDEQRFQALLAGS